MRLQTPKLNYVSLRLTTPPKIVRDVKEKRIRTKDEYKKYKLVFDKRVLDYETFESYPYGYL